jgi:hypothetical protein
MCEVGIKVHVYDGIDGLDSVFVDAPGIVIGHLGSKWAIVSLDNEPGRTVLVPDGTARRISGRAKGRAVVVQPSGRVSPLSREDSQRVHVRSPK